MASDILRKPSFNKIDFPVGETFTSIAQGFQFFADDWKEDRIPFFSRDIADIDALDDSPKYL